MTDLTIFTPRTETCGNCNNRYADCYDCGGVGEWPASCADCGEEKPLNEWDVCEACFALGMTEVVSDPLRHLEPKRRAA